MAAVRDPKPKVILSQPWTEIYHRNLVWNRKQNSNMAAVRFPKPEVVLSQPLYLIKIWQANRFPPS